MKLWQRRLILILALVLFLVISPALVFYAMGYRFSFENNEIRFVGMIDITSLPKETNIYLNDKYLDTGTPYAIKSLFPRKYHVKLEKEGYTSWEKSVFVESKKVTWIKNARLFIKNPGKKVLVSQEVDKFIKISEEEIILFSITEGENRGVWMYNIQTDEESKLFPKSEKEFARIGDSNSPLSFEFIDITKNNANLLFSYKESTDLPTKYVTINLKQQHEVNFLSDNLNPNIKKVSFGLNGDLMLNYLIEEKLFEFDLKEKKEKEIADRVLDFECQNNSLLIAIENEETISIQRKKKNSAFPFTNDQEFIFEIDKDELKQISQSLEGDIAVLTSSGKTYLFSAETKEVTEIADGIKNIKWGKESRKLIFRNSSEVYFFEVAKKEKEDLKQDYKTNHVNLITRYSKEIKNAGFFPDQEWVYILFDDEIKIIELDERDNRNTYQPIKDTPIDKVIYFDKKGEEIFFHQSDSKNIYSLKILDK